MSHTLIPKASAVSPLTWLVAIILTFALHVVFFLNYPMSQPSETTKKAISNSIEIGLKTDLKTISIPPSPTKVTPEKPKPVIKKSKPKPILKAIVKPKVIESTKTKESPIEENNQQRELETAASSATTASTSISATTPSLSSTSPVIKASYEASLVDWLQRYKRYPTMAKRRGQEDIIELKITIDKEGNVLSQEIIKTSLYKSLNRATLKMIKRASPLPPVPEDIQNNKTRFTFIIPVVFKLK